MIQWSITGNMMYKYNPKRQELVWINDYKEVDREHYMPKYKVRNNVYTGSLLGK